MSVVAADDDVFADGTPASGKPFPVDDVPVKAFLRAASAVPEPKKVSPNPTAAEIHMKEAGAPWRAKYEQQIASDNRVAKVELQQSRMTGLARQTCTGLDRVYGIKLDYTSFAARLSDAFKARERAKAASSLDDGGEEKGTEARDVGPSGDAQLIDAVMKFDLVKVAKLLGLKLPDKAERRLDV